MPTKSSRRRPGTSDFMRFLMGERADELDRIRTWLEKAREMREQGDLLKALGTAELHAAMIAAQDQRMPVSEVARLAGISRRAVYDIYAVLDRELD